MARLALPFLLLLTAVGAVLLGDAPGAPADFRFINRGDVSTLDPQKMSWMQDMRVARCVFEGLTRNDVFTSDCRVIPGVAERWEVAPGGLRYTFHLRPGARWSNGAPVTSRDFAYAWFRGLLPDTGCDYIGQFQVIRGGREFAAWRGRELAALAEARAAGRARPNAGLALWEETLRVFADRVGIRTPDDRTLEVELENPAPYFLDLCALAPFYPVYPPLVRRHERVDPATGRLTVEAGWTKPGRIVGNGPFVVAQWRFKRDMRLEANPHFWDAASLNIHSIVMPTVDDPSAQVLAFHSGAVDFLSDATPGYRADMIRQKQAFYREHQAECDRLRAEGHDPIQIDRLLPPDPRKNVHVLPTFGTYFYNLNCSARLSDGRPNPLADARVRRALAMAIDKRALTEQVRRTGEAVATTLVPTGAIAGYASPSGLAYDPGAARALLAEAGYPGGRGLTPIELLYNKDGEHDVIAQAVAKDWQQNLGVRVALVQKEIKVFRRDLKEQNYLAARGGWYGDYPDPLTFLDINRTGDENNDRNYSNPAYDALLARAAREADPAARLALLAEAERIIVEQDLPLIPLYRYVQVYMFDPHRVSGISPHPRLIENMFLIDVLGDGKGRDRPLAMPLFPERGPDAPGGAGVPEQGPAAERSGARHQTRHRDDPGQAQDVLGATAASRPRASGHPGPGREGASCWA
ncbi:MAG TPA: peptide ABC transporter substrate-binding protein [Phycisphaerales bacterium]|nr:peptide ABC transporter substrate-binding protein [Phycisphaerales bacterium]